MRLPPVSIAGGGAAALFAHPAQTRNNVDACSVDTEGRNMRQHSTRSEKVKPTEAPERGFTRWTIAALLLIWIAICPWGLVANAQAVPTLERSVSDSSTRPAVSICEKDGVPVAVKEALQLVCLRHFAASNLPVRNAIVIGFVGGFVKGDDLNHPEVHFASFLRDSYSSTVHAEVYANRDGQKALRRVLQLLDADEDGTLTAAEKQQANIIIYGHSWGASQTVTLARQLGGLGIPVLLTIQVDSVRKLGQEDSRIPSNVENAVNFYQPRGLIHGRSFVRAADPERTHVVGNFQMTYRDRRVNCANYRWLARVFNRPHHEIENDPLVWERVASLVDSTLWNARSKAQPASLSASSYEDQFTQWIPYAPQKR